MRWYKTRLIKRNKFSFSLANPPLTVYTLTMSEKTLTIRFKGKTINLRGKVFLHCDLIELLYNRLINDGFIVDIDTLFANIISKG